MRLEYFEMIDRVTALDIAGRSIVARCRVPEQSPVFEGHFPHYPLLPGVLMIEMMAQAGGWLLTGSDGFERIALLAQVRQAKMRASILPGEEIDASARVIHDGSGYAVARGTLTRDGREIAEAEIVYRTLPFPRPELRASMIGRARAIGFPEAMLA